MGIPNGYPINGGDFPAHNAGVTDIPANSCVVFDIANPPTNDQCMTVKIPAPAGAVTKPAGITVEVIKAGYSGRVRVVGAQKCVASGAVALGDYVRVDSAAGHEGQAKTATTGEAVLGRCIRGGADADEILVLVTPSGVSA